MENILTITNLTKEYEKVIALDSITLSIKKGSVFGLLGPNGAGKTSLIRILTGITVPDKGDFTLENVEGKDFDSLSKMIGYLPEERGLYKDMKIIDQLEFLGRIKGLSKKEVKEKIKVYGEKMEISDWFDKKAQELSKGMQQLVQFTSTIFFEPSLIILDEPFTGLDPINSVKLQNVITELKEQGKTVIFSTHRMEQVEEFCDDIALINKGKIILEGNIKDIKHRFKKNKYKVTGNRVQNSEANDFKVGDVIDEFEIHDINSDNIIVKDVSKDTSPNHLLKRLMKYIEVRAFVEILPSLSEIFIEQVNNSG